MEIQGVKKEEEQIVKILDRDNIRREKQRRNYEFTSIPGLFSRLQRDSFFIWSKRVKGI